MLMRAIAEAKSPRAVVAAHRQAGSNDSDRVVGGLHSAVEMPGVALIMSRVQMRNRM